MAHVSAAVAEIRYYTDYSNPAAPVLRLGAIAEAATEHSLVLAILGRETLTPEELEGVSGYNRRELEEVWKMLSRAFNAAWEHRSELDGPSTVGSMLKFLADQHSMSLHFEGPQRLPLPREISDRVVRHPKTLGNELIKLLERRLKIKIASRATPTRRKTSPRRVVHAKPRVSFRESTFTEAVAAL